MFPSTFKAYKNLGKPIHLIMSKTSFSHCQGCLSEKVIFLTYKLFMVCWKALEQNQVPQLNNVEDYDLLTTFTP